MKKKTIKFLTKEINLGRSIRLCIHDIRHHPQIPFEHIISQIILMPFLSMRSFLALDTISRNKLVRKWFRCKRKMVCSDSTMARVLRWVSPHELQTFTLGFLALFEQHSMLVRTLIHKGRSRRIGIIDGSHMGGHWITCLTLIGSIRLPVLIDPYKNQGHELASAHRLLNNIPCMLKKHAPTLYLLDSLYFNKNIFSKIVHELEAHLIIKSKKPEFRAVLTSADRFIVVYDKDTLANSAFDCKRQCQYTIYATEDTFADIPIRIIKVREEYVKRHKNKDTEFYVVATDMTMSAEEIREAGHLRWEIENNVFKRLNHHCGTKTQRVKDSRAFVNWLYLVCLGIALFDFLLCILKKHKAVWDEILDGRKATWHNIQSALIEHTNIHSVLVA